ncbi:Transmembrane protein TauE like [Macleaya cordata]|uniref:Transmembrane protein TauE like n=1 Tax=Macleaya cordata TaxID=56857 RepID=A0A200Q006_MACCD|nr:Transmembrane protein TauE like [Macleaya cordata]
MAEFRARIHLQEISLVAAIVGFTILLASVLVSAEINLKNEASSRYYNGTTQEVELDYYFLYFRNFLWKSDGTGYQHVWPEMKFGWRIIIGSIVGFFGAALGSGGGVGGGGIFVPMLTLIIGFDSKSSAPISKCMIVGTAASTVYYNLKRRHPTLDMPIIDYNLALLVQPMLMLGISIGVALNVVFANWMVTVLLIFFFAGTSTMAFFKGVETWKKETILKKVVHTFFMHFMWQSTGSEEVAYKPLPSGPSHGTHEERNASEKAEVPILENVQWRELGLLVFVWVSFLVVQIVKINTATCYTAYWVLNLMQIPISVGVTLHEAVSLYKGKKAIASMGEGGRNFKVHQLILYSFFGLLAGTVGGMLGLAGGFILGPVFLELGIPPQVSSATTTFAITFSASMSVVEYYLLNRFPVPYALYFVAVATVAALVGQRVVSKMIIILGRTSLIIFILALIIFMSAISLGGVGIANMIGKIERNEYMGFENLCKYDA